MNRLVIRLVLAMLLVVIISLIAVPLAQGIIIQRTFDELTPEFRKQVLERTKPPRWHRKRPPPPPRAHQGPFHLVPRPKLREHLCLLPNLANKLELRKGICQEFPPPNRFSIPNQGFTLPNGANQPDDRLIEREVILNEYSRLLSLFGDYRLARQRGVMFGLICAITVSCLLAIWLSRSIAKPIEAVSLAAHKVSEGNLSARVNLKKFSRQTKESQLLAQDFNNMASALEQYEGERKAMLADIAHELRTPLATMQLRLDALADGLLVFGKEEAQLLQAQVELLSRLINDLRTLSLADAGQLSLHKSEVDLNVLVENLITNCRDRAKQAEVSLIFSASKEPAKIYADPDRLMQVLHNLLDNALRVTPKGGWTRISLEVNEQIVLSVRDSGPGIPEDQLQGIFERFTKGVRRDTKDKEGSGLGLAIVHTLVKLHGGKVVATNHEEGAEFTITFPCLTSNS